MSLQGIADLIVDQITAHIENDLALDGLRLVWDELSPDVQRKALAEWTAIVKATLAAEGVTADGAVERQQAQIPPELEEMGEDELDDVVHELKSLEAAQINDAGRDAQLAYIGEQWMGEEMAR
jgi:hypothetical protein